MENDDIALLIEVSRAQRAAAERLGISLVAMQRPKESKNEYQGQERRRAA